MATVEQLNIGIVGAAGRGASFRAAFDAHPVTRIHAVCDVQEEALAEAAERLGAAESYTDYDEMIEQSEIDAVVIGTPMPLHVPQAIAALERGLHVLSEVPAGTLVSEVILVDGGPGTFPMLITDVLDLFREGTVPVRTREFRKESSFVRVNDEFRCRPFVVIIIIFGFPVLSSSLFSFCFLSSCLVGFSSFSSTYGTPLPLCTSGLITAL